jgi:hypothetical protein
MTNQEKLMHLQSMLENASTMADYCRKKIEEGEDSFTLKLSHDAFVKDAAALKFAIKGINLMNDLIYDQSEEGGDYGF